MFDGSPSCLYVQRHPDAVNLSRSIEPDSVLFSTLGEHDGFASTAATAASCAAQQAYFDRLARYKSMPEFSRSLVRGRPASAPQGGRRAPAAARQRGTPQQAQAAAVRVQAASAATLTLASGRTSTSTRQSKGSKPPLPRPRSAAIYNTSANSARTGTIGSTGTVTGTGIGIVSGAFSRAGQPAWQPSSTVSSTAGPDVDEDEDPLAPLPWMQSPMPQQPAAPPSPTLLNRSLSHQQQQAQQQRQRQAQQQAQAQAQQQQQQQQAQAQQQQQQQH